MSPYVLAGKGYLFKVYLRSTKTGEGFFSLTCLLILLSVLLRYQATLCLEALSISLFYSTSSWFSARPLSPLTTLFLFYFSVSDTSDPTNSLAMTPDALEKVALKSSKINARTTNNLLKIFLFLTIF